MEKTMTLNLRVNPTVKQQAEDVLKQLGIPMATAIDMYLRQITMTGGIPFSLSLPKAPNCDVVNRPFFVVKQSENAFQTVAVLLKYCLQATYFHRYLCKKSTTYFCNFCNLQNT